ncbi:MAG: hypothetical protein RLZ37_1263 [Actinomycetota bacterium]
MADEANKKAQPVKKQESASIGEVIDLVRDYAKQETLGPLKGAGRWLMLGTIGSILLGLGLLLVLVAILRLLQTEVSAFDGAFSWVPYAVVLVISIILTVIALSRIRQATLGKEPK